MGYTDEPRDVKSTGCPEGPGLTGETGVNHTNPGVSSNIGQGVLGRPGPGLRSFTR